MILLSILICHLPERKVFYDNLRAILDPQITKHQFEVEVLTDSSDKHKKSIGKKRNDLMQLAEGKYLCFIDDDDEISDDYLDVILQGCVRDVDAIELKGIITEDGLNPKLFIHSMRYDHWFEKDNIYYRNNNHLSPVRSSIAKKMTFPEVNMSEDHEYSRQLQASGLIKTEWPVEKPYYFYKYRRNK